MLQHSSRRHRFIEAKLQHAEERLEEIRRERDHEEALKREVRKLKEEDFRVLVGRLRRKDVTRKLQIIEKEFESAESVERARAERERFVEANAERHKQQSQDKWHLNNAVAKLLHLQSPHARERYLREHQFDQTFLARIKAKLPALLDTSKKKPDEEPPKKD